MDFVKMEGLGNDFVVLRGPASPAAADVAAWCDRRRGIGADGLLVVTSLGADRVRMEYWNADGSPAEMCGNGLRCVGRFAVLEGLASGPGLLVETPVGELPVTVPAEGPVRALVGRFAEAPVAPLDLAGYHLESVTVGNPHAVAFVDDCYSVPVAAVGPIVAGDPHFPQRTNVGFATVVSSQRLDLRVWERGAGETLACGTGAAAAAGLAHRRGLTGPRVTVMLPGGPLEIEIEGDRVWMEGPARAVFRGSM
ncbi:MAG: diaminopimelate epimerase [Acidimicrobiia bacterium]|nr:diaminopimelate epimerase [Acidimicrobiia bacterium]